MAEVVFITPNTKGNIENESLGTLLLTTILRQNGIDAEILQFFRFGDPKAFSLFLETAVRMILEKKPRIVSFYTRCDNYHIMLTIARLLKQESDVVTVFAGPQADIVAEETLKAMPYVDYVCCGEGENTVYPFFSGLLRQEPDLGMPGLVYRSGENVIRNPRPVLTEDLDTLPFPDYGLLGYEISAGDRVDIDVGRGCPFGCVFCSTKLFWGRKYRLKSPERIISEIRQLHETYGVYRFSFTHDMFTMNRRQIVKTCSLLRQLDFSIEWKCSARLDCIDDELIDIMADAGMKSIYFGIETGSPRMQKLTNKNLSLDGVMEKLAGIRAKGLRFTASFIYGFPDETEEDLSMTLSLIRQIAEVSSDVVQAHMCTFLPGTELTQRYQSGLVPAQSFSDITGNVALEECAEMIEDNPLIFRHFREYPTELRERTRFLTVFVMLWCRLQPVYGYMAEKYPANRLIDMYYDFESANRELLRQIKDQPLDRQIGRLLAEDRFVQRLKDDENYGVISDICKIERIKSSEEMKKPGSVVRDVFAFSPAKLRKGIRLQSLEKRISFVTFIRQENGEIRMVIKSM